MSVKVRGESGTWKPHLGVSKPRGQRECVRACVRVREIADTNRGHGCAVCVCVTQ